MRSFVVIAALLASAACSREPLARLDTSQFAITVAAEMRTDTLGDSATPVTFILVDAENRSGHDANLTLVGDLQDGARASVAKLHPEELFVPAGAARTFALVDGSGQARPEARGATVEIRTATIARHPPPFIVTDLTLFQDPVQVEGGRAARAVVAANITNDAKRPGSAIVLASFHDERGRPLTRPFAVVQLGAGYSRPVRFVGPPGSTDGVIYVGDVTF